MSKVLMQSLTLTAKPLNPKPLNPCAFLRRADGSVVADHISTRLTMRPWFWGDFLKEGLRSLMDKRLSPKP